VVGRELGRKIRPCVIISTNDFNESGTELAIVVPSTTSSRPFPTHVVFELRGPRGPVTMSFCCEYVRAISVERLRSRLGDIVVPQTTILEIDRILRRIMGL
jgi:mRNA-degrading endonuclease toxin of MazEF toxin-antitoxin module